MDQFISSIIAYTLILPIYILIYMENESVKKKDKLVVHNEDEISYIVY